MTYVPADDRYDRMAYRRCGRSGLLLPAVSLGLWHNFGHDRPLETSRAIVRRAFDLGITHFDLANNYGPPYGSAEETFGKLLHDDLRPYRDELVISTKAGYDMWPGPYGEWGSRKYLLSSLDQSLRRMGLEYVDIFYSQILERLGRRLLIHQPSYSMLNRWVEDGLLDVLGELGVGCIVFSPLGQGLLSDRYLEGIPEGSRASRNSSFSPEMITDDVREKLRALNDVARQRGQTLAQMAIAWTLRDPQVTSALVGASSVKQLEDNVRALDRLDFSDQELAAIDRFATESGINLWARSSAD
jgi:L-glyceraldehyde 3-phosphate reductase